MNQHLIKVLQGEYNIPITIQNPLILDIGSNVGSFMTWVLTKKYIEWSNPVIYCYEPMKKNFEYLKKNKLHLGNSGYNIKNIHLINNAVGNPKNAKLFHGKNNCGEASFYDIGEQNISNFELVETIGANLLPKAHIVKIDTEGSEIDIIKNLQFKPIIIMLEYHSETDRRAIDNILTDYILYECVVSRCASKHNSRGIVKYIHLSYLHNI